jgi:MFS transporter, YNFM family, putative membrane transport protein
LFPHSRKWLRIFAISDWWPYAIGFGVLFNFIATFTYVSFHLAAPPYLFSPTLLGALFLTYLVSSPIVPWVGRAIALFGRRPFILGVIALWIIGALLLLAPPVAVIMVGLTLCATCGMVCQAVSTGYVTLTAKEGRSSAVGLYASMYYIGGSVGAFLTGLAWTSAGWGGCVALIVAVQAIMALIVTVAWDSSGIKVRHIINRRALGTNADQILASVERFCHRTQETLCSEL